MRLICAIFLIFVAFCKSDNGEVEANFEDAKEILPGRTYYWKNWRFCQNNCGHLHIWSEAVALRFWTYNSGYFDFIIDYKLRTVWWHDDRLYNDSDSDYEDLLHTLKIMNNSTTQAQPILSHAGNTKLALGYWFLDSRKEGEISIEYGKAPLVITLQEDIRSFTVKSKGTNDTFSAKTLLGAEFLTSWIPHRKINQSSLRADAHKSEGDQGNVEACCEDANEILPGQIYYWKNWYIYQDINEQRSKHLYIWLETAALIFWAQSGGCINFVVNNRLWEMCYDDERVLELSNSAYEYYSQQIRKIVKSSNHTQPEPIFSHADSTKLDFGNWFLVSHKEGEISIHYRKAPLIITLRENFHGFTIDSNGNEQLFSPRTLPIPCRKINHTSQSGSP